MESPDPNALVGRGLGMDSPTLMQKNNTNRLGVWSFFRMRGTPKKRSVSDNIQINR